MPRIGRTIVAAIVLAAAVAGPVAAAGPEIYREEIEQSGVDDGWTAACGFTVTNETTGRATYTTWGDRWAVHYQALRTLTGAGSTLIVRNNYSFGGPMASSLEDPDAGTFTERGQTVTTGVRVIVEPATGKVFQVAGYYFEDVTAVYGPGDAFSLTIHEQFSHGQHPTLSESDFQALICGALGA